MRIVKTTTEIDEYLICSHLDAYLLLPMSGEENRNRPPLRCDIFPAFLEQRDVDYDEWCGDLIDSLVEACRGRDPKWLLVSVQLSHDGVTFDFCDSTTSSDEKDYKKRLRSVYFPDFHGFFKIEADHPGNELPDEYYVKFQFGTVGGEDDEDDEDGEDDKDNGTETFALINIRKNGELFAQEHLIAREDGKIYLQQLKYD